MARNFLHGLFRNLARNRTNTFINIASLTVGLAVFAFAFLYVKQELSYDQNWPDADRVHRVIVEQQGIPGRPDGSFDAVVAARHYPALPENFPDHIEKATRLFGVSVDSDDAPDFRYRSLTLVDPEFADIFQMNVVAGSLEAALAGPGFIAIEESLANSFREPLQLGSRVELRDPRRSEDGTPSGSSREYEVAAIFRTRAGVSSPMRFQMLSLLNDYSLHLLQGMKSWDQGSHRIWLKLQPGAEAAALQAQTPAMIERVITAYNELLKPGDRISDHIHYRFQPVTDIHLQPLSHEQGGDPDRVLTIAAVGMLVLLAGCSNSVSLGLAGILERRREIGIRKAAGAQRRDIMLHYLGESMLLGVLALIPALLLFHFLRPPMLVLLNITNATTPALVDYLTLCAIAAAVGLLSGAYPAWVLAGVKPQAVLSVAGGRVGRGAGMRALLVGFQFCFALTLMIATLALYLQLAVVRQQPLGFNATNLMLASVSPEQGRASIPALVNELRNTPGVVDVVANSNLPFITSTTVNDQKFIGPDRTAAEVSAQLMTVDPRHFEILQIPLLAGRSFDPARDIPGQSTEGDDATAPREFRMMLNHAASRALGFATPEQAADAEIHWRSTGSNGKLSELPVRLIGVVGDSMYSSLRRRPVPELYMMLPYTSSSFLLKFEGKAATTIQQEIERTWQRVMNAKPQRLWFFETGLDAAFNRERNESRLLLYCAGLALLLSCIGLYGLAAFTMERRIKEVGVRKVLGAGLPSLTSLFLWRYLRPILLAHLIAVPLASYFIVQWLQRFPYQLEKWWLLPVTLTAGVAVLLVAVFTVTGVVIKAARTQPARALRCE